jgi:fructose-bisphosphate aldolase class II
MVLKRTKPCTARKSLPLPTATSRPSVPLTPTADVVSSACRDGRAVGAFDVITLEHAEAVVTGAEAAGCPVICQISENAVRFHGSRLAPIALATAALAEAATVPVALHLDHVTDEALLRHAADCGFGSVMSTRPRCRTPRTSSPRARRRSARTARLDHGLIARLAKAVPVPLVLHGSTGVPDGELRQAVAVGMVKVNIGTALNAAFTGAVRDTLAAAPVAVDPRPALTAARRVMADAVTSALRVLWGGGYGTG